MTEKRQDFVSRHTNPLVPPPNIQISPVPPPINVMVLEKVQTNHYGLVAVIVNKVAPELFFEEFEPYLAFLGSYGVSTDRGKKFQVPGSSLNGKSWPNGYFEWFRLTKLMII